MTYIELENNSGKNTVLVTSFRCAAEGKTIIKFLDADHTGLTLDQEILDVDYDTFKADVALNSQEGIIKTYPILDNLCR